MVSGLRAKIMMIEKMPMVISFKLMLQILAYMR